MQEQTKERSYLKSVIDAPYRFKVLVEDPTHLPPSLKKEKELSFTLTSPTLGVLSKVALILSELSEEDLKLLESQELQKRFSLIHKHIDKLSWVLCVLLWGKQEDPPVWWKDFLMSNLSQKELTELLFEAGERVDTSFFLPCFQMTKLMSQGIRPALT